MADAGDDPGFEAFVRARVGQGAYQAFYRPYAEKVWGLPATLLSSTVAKKRVSSSSPLELVRETLRGRTRTFEYPRHGMAALVHALRAEAVALGVSVEHGRRFTPADAPAWDRVLYSGDLDALVPGSGLEHRGLHLVFLALPVESLGETDTYYVPEERYWFGRVSIPASFSSALARPGESILCVEIPEGRWGPRHDFLGDRDELLRQLREARILPRGVEPVDALQLHVPRVYPLYRRGWRAAWEEAMHAVAGHGNIFPIGRQGLFLHCNIDHCVAISREVVAHTGEGAGAWVRRAARWLDVRVRD
jgi:hypothetical protein